MIYEYCSHTHAARRRRWPGEAAAQGVLVRRTLHLASAAGGQGEAGGCGVGFVSDISWQFMVGQVDFVVVLLFAICAYNGSSSSSRS